MNFKRKLPVPLDVKTSFPVSEHMATVKAKRDEEINSVFYELAQHIAFLVNTLNLQCIYIGGIEQMYVERISELIRDRIHVQWPYTKKQNLAIRSASFGSLAVAYGAAAMYIDQLFSLPSLSTPSEKGLSILEYLSSVSLKKGR